MLNFRNLRITLLIAFLSVSLIPLVILGYKVKSEGEEAIRSNVFSHLQGLSSRNADTIRWFIKERASDLRLLSYTISMKNPEEREALKKHLSVVKKQYRVYVGFVIRDSEGVRHSTFGDSNTELILSTPLNIVLEASPKTIMSDVFIIKTGGVEKPAIIISTEIGNSLEEGTVLLYGLVDFTQIEESLKKGAIKDTGEVYLVNKEGFFITTSRLGGKILVDKVPVSLNWQGSENSGFYETTDYRDKKVLHSFNRLDEFSWVVVSEQDWEEAFYEINRLRKKIIAYGAIFLIMALLLAYFISSQLVNTLKAKYKYEKELEFQLIQNDKLAALGLLTASLSHELNTPLANALLYTQMAGEELGESDEATIRAKLTAVEEEIKQGSKIVRNLLEFSRRPDSGKKEADVNGIIERLLAIASMRCASKDIAIVKKLDPFIPLVRAEESVVQEILTNLTANAIEAMPKGGTLKISSRFAPALRKVKIDIADTGVGIPKEIQGKIFEPFFTTKAEGRGIGLGLFVSYEMARRLGGAIKVISSHEKEDEFSGTIFTVELPAIDKNALDKEKEG